jgi:hypothetical protein
MAQRSVRSACEHGSYATFVKVSYQMGDQNLLSRTPPCFERHVKLLVLAALAFLRSIYNYVKAIIVCTHFSTLIIL